MCSSDLQHREGILLADAVEGGDGFQHGISPGELFYWRAVQRKRAANANRVNKREAPDLDPGLPTYLRRTA